MQNACSVASLHNRVNGRDGNRVITRPRLLVDCPRPLAVLRRLHQLFVRRPDEFPSADGGQILFEPRIGCLLLVAHRYQQPRVLDLRIPRRREVERAVKLGHLLLRQLRRQAAQEVQPLLCRPALRLDLRGGRRPLRSRIRLLLHFHKGVGLIFTSMILLSLITTARIQFCVFFVESGLRDSPSVNIGSVFSCST